MAREVNNSDDVIDSRDVIARIEALEEEREAAVDTVREAVENADLPDADVDETLAWREESIETAGAEWDRTYEGQELAALKALADEAEGYAADWRHGETLIRDSYFEQYARELAEDIGAIKGNEAWPLSYIDWSAAADALKQDYTSVDFDGVTYWIR